MHKPSTDSADYTEKMEYNGRHLITKIHYRARQAATRTRR